MPSAIALWGVNGSMLVLITPPTPQINTLIKNTWELQKTCLVSVIT